MIVSDAMTTDVVTIGPSHSLREASKVMADRKIGSVVVHDPEADGPGILTERDIVSAVAGGSTSTPRSQRTTSPPTPPTAHPAGVWTRQPTP